MTTPTLDPVQATAGPAPELKEVRGPSALGGGWRRSLELLYLMAVMEFKRTYHNTALGYLWSVCRPLFTFAVLLAVFTRLVRAGTNVPHYPMVLLFGIVFFGFFTEATTTAQGSIVSQEAVVRKTQFPRLVIPLAAVTTALFNLGLNLGVTLVFMLCFGIHPMWTWLLLPVLLLWMLVLTVSVSMILSSLYPRFRDLGIIWTVLSTALFYGTPVIYSLKGRIGSRTGQLVALNPLTPLMETAQRWMINPGSPVYGGAARIAVPAVITLGLCGLAIWVFNREAPRIAEAL